MTPPLLEHPLVKKYFGCRPGELVPCDNPQTFNVAERMALRILQAMSAPVKEGELYLAISEYGKVTGPQAFTSSDNWVFHCQWLRLPDSFQPPPEREKHCQGVCECGELLRHKDQPPSTAGCEHGFKDKENCPIETPYPNPNPETASPCKPSHGLDSTCDQCKPKTAGCCCLGVSHDCPTCHKKPGITKCGCSCHISLGSQTHFQCDCPCQKPTPAPSAVEQRIEWLVRNLPDITKPIWKTLLQEFAALVRQEGK